MVGGQRQNPDPTQSGCFSIAHLMRIGIARGRDTCGDTGRGKHQIRRGMIILDAAE